MAYAARMPGRNRTVALVTVAGLHGMAFYALVTGLGVQYVEQIIPSITGRNIPLDPPPPSPEPKPQTTPDVANHSVQHVPAPAPRLAMPRPGPIEVDVGSGVDDIRILDFPLDTHPQAPRPAPSLATGTARAARPVNAPAGWVSTDDYPGASLRRGEQGTVRFELTVAADGRVQACRVTASSGSAELDTATCRLVSRRARFDAATDESGARVGGTYAGSIRWVIPQD